MTQQSFGNFRDGRECDRAMRSARFLKRDQRDSGTIGRMFERLAAECGIDGFGCKRFGRLVFACYMSSDSIAEQQAAQRTARQFQPRILARNQVR